MFLSRSVLPKGVPAKIKKITKKIYSSFVNDSVTIGVTKEGVAFLAVTLLI